MVCQGGNGKHCREDGVTYYITCKGCGNIYIGKMASNAYTRGLEHARVLKNKSKDSDLFSHSIDKHHHTTTSSEYNLEVTHFYTGDTNRQQISEALMIKKTSTNCHINRRDEFRRCRIPTLVVTAV